MLRSHPQIVLKNLYFRYTVPITIGSVWDKGYRYGFNSMVKDNEIKVNGGDYDFGERIYGSSLGRWLSVDPIERALESDYVSFSDSSIVKVDPDRDSNHYTADGELYTLMIRVSTKSFVNGSAKKSDENTKTDRPVVFKLKMNIKLFILFSLFFISLKIQSQNYHIWDADGVYACSVNDSLKTIDTLKQHCKSYIYYVLKDSNNLSFYKNTRLGFKSIYENNRINLTKHGDTMPDGNWLKFEPQFDSLNINTCKYKLKEDFNIKNYNYEGRMISYTDNGYLMSYYKNGYLNYNSLLYYNNNLVEIRYYKKGKLLNYLAYNNNFTIKTISNYKYFFGLVFEKIYHFQNGKIVMIEKEKYR